MSEAQRRLLDFKYFLQYSQAANKYEKALQRMAEINAGTPEHKEAIKLLFKYQLPLAPSNFP